MIAITWVGIGICIVHSAVFSGLNLALFGLTRLRLEVEAGSGNRHAANILKLRSDSHYLLTTILWGNVAFNTLLAILSNSVLTGVLAFVFSTFFITFFGEILPQAYFSKHALKSDGTPYGKMDDGQNFGIPVEKCARKYIRAIRKNKREVYIGGKEILMVYFKRYLPKLFYKLAANVKPT